MKFNLNVKIFERLCITLRIERQRFLLLNIKRHRLLMLLCSLTVVFKGLYKITSKTFSFP